jgi:two-component system cell cycle sensor histidine kinase/response regulator CckA
MPDASPASVDAALVEAARGAPAAFYQFRLSPTGAYSFPFISPDFVARYGVEQGEPEETAARFFSRIHPDDLDPIREAISRSAKSLESFEIDFRFRDVTDAEVWVEARSKPERASDGGVLWNGIVTDITARKNAEAAVRETEERYRSLFAADPHPMWFFDTETLAFLEVNDAAVAHYGFSKDEFLAMTIADIRPPEDVPRLRRALGRVGEGAIHEAGVWRHRKKDGSVISVEITSHAVEYGGRRAEVVLVNDITERMNSEAALRESETRLRLFVRHAPAALAMFDRDMRYITASLRWLSDYGLADREVTGLSHYDVLPEVPERWKETHRRGLAGEVVRAEEDLFERADGSVQWIRWEIRPWRTEGGDVGGIVIFAEDITARKKAEESLRRKEEILEQAQSVAGAGSWTSELAARTLDVSPECARLLGWKAGLHQFEELLTVVHPEDVTRMRAAWTAAFAGAPYDIEHRVVVNAEVRWLHARARLEFGPDGKAVRAIGVSQDVTASHQAAEALRASEERFRVMFDVAPVGVAQADPATGRWLAVNPRMCLITGYSADELLAKRVSEITHPEDRDRDWNLFQNVVKGEAPEYRLEKRYVRKDGSIAWVNVNMVVLRDAAGHPTRTLAMIEDITERKLAGRDVVRLNAELEEALEWQRQIFEGSRDAVFLSDEEGRFVAVNHAAEELTGFSRVELRGMRIQDLHHEPDLEAYRTFHHRIMAGERILSASPIRRKDGRRVSVEFNNSLVVIGGKRFMHTAARDTTERVRLEEQLRQAQKMEAIGQLAGGVAHDFNNLLTVISGNSELLLSGTPADDPRRAALSDIRAAGERAAGLTRQLLAFSRKQILEPKLVDAHEVVAGIEKMLRRLIGEDVEILTDLAADPSWVKVDPGQLEQVIMNLAVNARDAMPRGGRLTIATRNIDSKEPVDLEETAGRLPRPRVAISISDTGDGISPKVKPHLFEPFFTTKAVGKGTGLGLATVYGIVKQSGGDVTVESEPGKGATFTVVLPSRPAPRRRGSGASLHALPRGTETVLVVEDEDAVRRIVKIALESTGYRVIEARSGSEALEAARAQAGKIDILVTDVVMPEMSGREVAARITETHPGTRILYMSGYTDDAVVRHGIVESGVAFLQKPFSPLALARKVREVLDSPA